MPLRTPATPSTTRRRPSRTSKLFGLHRDKERAVLRGGPFLLRRGHCEERSGAPLGEHRLVCFARPAMTKLLVAAVLVLGACRDQRPPAPTAEQSAQLNDADNMLNAMARNEEGPADRSTGPSNRT